MVGRKAGAGGLELVERLSSSSSSFVVTLSAVLAAKASDKIDGDTQSYIVNSHNY